MEQRKKIEIAIIVVAILIVLVSTVTYAFFQAQLMNSMQQNANISSNTTDSLTFDINNEINLNINQFNFGVGAGNLGSNATGTVRLLANNSTNTATYGYYVYFSINSNEFVYTTSDSKPEILLTITDPTGAKVTSVSGLTYKENVTTTTSDGTQQTVSGFDITTANGVFTIASNYQITANSTTATTQQWQFTVSFINLDSDQQANANKSMNANIIMQKNAM